MSKQSQTEIDQMIQRSQVKEIDWNRILKRFDLKILVFKS